MKIIIVAILFVVCSLTACSNATGAITIMNNGDKPLRGSLDDTGFTVQSGGARNFIDVPAKDYTLSIAGQDEQNLTVTEGHTHIIDPIQSRCYALVDYQSQYRGHERGSVKIIQTYKAKPEFTITTAVTVPFNEALPKEAEKNTPVTRIQPVECTSIDDEQAMTAAVLRLP